ncbi:hypothetical protein BDN71DRAFT_1507518 [Pleurotus eryngii]|uniref:Uncharacterized protein n=1 Tax=Pleurotus eryngii TaxID=5323 RepID=A0A9P5ZYA3_PLEER|nr:hypothetical protein BDN71DRAFT_1507518 [Pleurotus eryngii]
MDHFYNKSNAVESLDRIIAERVAIASSLQMYSMDSGTTEKYSLSISREDGDVASRLTQRNEEMGEMEEATVALQGIVSYINLPPFESNRSDGLKRLVHIRQTVTLMGLGSTHFQQIVNNCRCSYSMFSWYTPNAKLLPAPEFIGKYSEGRDNAEHVTITASNRFFTPVQQSAGLEVVDVNGELDPQGILAKVDTTKFLHTEDNAVGYYVLSTSGGGSKSLPTTPIVFQIGDIVEVQVSMTCIPNKGNFTVKMLLRSIMLLNGKFTTDATTARTLSIPAAIAVALLLPK